MEWSDVSPHLTGLAHLATVTGRGRPHVSIVSPRVEGDVIWFGALRSSKKVRNLAVHPFAALVWAANGEAYVDVSAVIVDDVEEKRRLWDGWPYDPTAFFGTPVNPDYVLVRGTPVSATVVRSGDDGLERLRWTADR